MKGIRNPLIEEDLLRKLWEEMDDPDRPNQWPGVTTLIYCLTKAYYERTWPSKGKPPRQTLMLFTTGLWLEKLILGKEQNATVNELDGIWGHTDHVDIEGERVDDVKSTRTSMAGGFDKLSIAWHRQFMAYFKQEGVGKGRVIVLHLMGDYKPPFPDIAVYDLETDQQEIDDNWQWMLDRKQTLDQHLELGVAPEPYTYRVADWKLGLSEPQPVRDKEDFECQRCPYKLMCETKTSGGLSF